MTEIVAGRLHALGATVPLDGRITWVPEDATGYQPISCYLLLEGRRALLVDGGLPAHAGQILDQLGRVLAPGTELSLFTSRPELDACGNVQRIALRFPLARTYSGGQKNPFDALDQIAALGTELTIDYKKMELERRSEGGVIDIGPERSLRVLRPPLRMVGCFWSYDTATRTLFTADSFGHHTSTDPAYRPVAAPGSLTYEDFRRFTRARYWWVEGGHVDKIQAALAGIFEHYPIDRIAPTHGCVVEGTGEVRRHYEMMCRLLEESNAAPRRTIVPMTPTAAPATGASAPRPDKPRRRNASLRREIAPGIHWLSTCAAVQEAGVTYHTPNSTYLVCGTERTMMVDTGNPEDWPSVERMLDEILGDRPIDYLAPTHTELPHSGNIARLLRKYPAAKAVGEVRDYHVFYPELASRFEARPGDTPIDLGGGYAFSRVTACLLDLPATQWIYESKERVLFVADGFAWLHRVLEIGAEDGVVHHPGECGALTSELIAPPRSVQAQRITRTALAWARVRHADDKLRDVAALFERYPARLVAPTHGNVIADAGAFVPVLTEAFTNTFDPDSW